MFLKRDFDLFGSYSRTLLVLVPAGSLQPEKSTVSNFEIHCLCAFLSSEKIKQSQPSLARGTPRDG